MAGSFVLILHTHLPYVIRHGKWPHGSDWLSEAAAECYLPILNECFDLLDEGITPAITISLSPVVVEQLADEEFPAIFNDYLDEKIASAESDILYFEERPHEQEYIPLARYWSEWYSDRKRDFNERYASDIVGAFRRLREHHAVALQTCGATHGYFPLLAFDETISAQLDVAVDSHHHHFGESPRGIWMPECAYRPCYEWTSPVPSPYAPSGTRKGVEQLLAEHRLDYTVVDSHLTRGGRPLGIYASRFEAVRRLADIGARFLPLDDSRSVHDIYRVCSTGETEAGMMAVFTRDTETTLHVWSGTYGYPGDPNYLDFHKKHHNSGHRYWRVTGAGVDLAAKTIYRPEVVDERIRENARHFLRLVEQELIDFRVSTGRDGTLAAPFDTELFGHWWFEGPRFLGELLRQMSRSPIVRAATAPDDLDEKNPGVVIQLPEGSWGEGGAHNVWLNEGTAWTWPMIHEVEAKLLRLIETHDESDQEEARILRQLARESMLLAASDWQFLITTASAADYAEERFREHYDSAILLATMIEGSRSGMPPSLADTEELARLESVNRIFPNLSLRAWSDRKDVTGAQHAAPLAAR